jgi:alpha-glucosidase
VIYQIYPRSFQDSDGDGVGDLRGIAERLPHIADLGADAIWISPFFTSPMKDFGYDVSYTARRPDVRHAGRLRPGGGAGARLGLRVMIDLVLSHTSRRRIRGSRRAGPSRDNHRADWYVWADPKPDGTPPNNWAVGLGGPPGPASGAASSTTCINFLSSQPDLNLHTPAVQEALLDVVRFWLRAASTASARHDQLLLRRPLPARQPAPPKGDAERLDRAVGETLQPPAPPVLKNQPENLDFLRRFRAELVPYGAAAVGEVGDAQRGLEIMAEYTSGGDKVQMCYPFELLQPPGAPAQVLATTFDRLAAPRPTPGPAGATRTTTPCATSPAGACPTRPPAPTLPS